MIPEELYNSLKALGYKNDDIEKVFLEDIVLQLYAKHTITFGKAASLLGLTVQTFRETLINRGLPVEYFTEDMYEEDLHTIKSIGKDKL